jgi:hypothetical protein
MGVSYSIEKKNKKGYQKRLNQKKKIKTLK